MSRLLTVLCVLVGALALATPAHAARSQDLVFDAPRDVLDAERRPAALDEIQRLGVRSLRVVLYWKNVAPSATARRRPSGDLTDPARYAWNEYDGVVAAARERGMKVVLTLTTPGPRWAMRGRRDHVTRPSAREFGRFVEAAAKRYGSHVDTWAVGNEPRSEERRVG